MSRTTKVVVASTAAGALALGVGVGIAGLASADPTSSPSSKPSASSTTGPGRGGPGHGHRGGPGRGAFDEAVAKQLAEKLGIDPAKVTDALKAIREANRPTARPSPPRTRISPP